MIIETFFAGLARAQTARFTSVQEAVQQLPELSVLNAQVSKISLADKLKDPNFVGTVFAPINSVSGLLVSRCEMQQQQQQAEAQAEPL